MEQPHSERRADAPKKLGRYRILHEVGRGATAFVFKAYDPQLDRFLAIKVLRPELANDEDYRDSFLKEARLAAQLAHPGIVTIYDVGVADGKPYIGMELLEGATLENILKNQHALNLKTTLAMAQQLSRALNYAHKQGVVHRDIKPGNIVVLKDKKTVKLTDFGIAQLDDNLGQAGKRSDKVMGTPEYMAPEQILGQPMDNRTDLYAFGVLLYRMLCGFPPFKSDDLGQLFKQIVKSRPPALKVDIDKVQDDVQDLVRKLLRKNPLKRFQSAAEVTAELSRIQNRLSSHKGDKGKSFVSLRLRWTATMAGVVFVALCISLAVVYLVQYRALSGITFDYGRSIARMLAYESAEPILLGDKLGLNALIKESSENEQLTSVYVMDPDNIILASTDADKVDQMFVAPPGGELQQTLDQVKVYERTLGNRLIMFDIEMPIQYAGKSLGSLYITFNANSMYLASKTTLISMVSVMLIMLLVVFAVTLTLARRTSRDLQRVTQALAKVASGRFDARLPSERNDETGQLFNAFNQMAEVIEHQIEPAKDEAILEPDTATRLSVTSNNANLEETVELNIEPDANNSNNQELNLGGH